MATLLILLSSVALATAPSDPLYETARDSLTRNIVSLPSGDYLVAGQNQFLTLWTRDFCFASRGLLKIGRADVVRNQLDRLIRFRRAPDSLVPRLMDSMSSEFRVNHESVSRLLSCLPDRFPIKEPLHQEFLDEHGSEAIDSNALVLLTALDYVKATGDTRWWNERRDALVRIYRFYDERRDPSDGLLVQKKFSDWQDSVRREGKTFYANLLYYVVSKRLAFDSAFGVKPAMLAKLRDAIERTFFDEATGLYRTMVGQPHVSLDGNLLAIDWGYHEPGSPRADALFVSLRVSRLWTGGPENVPGWVTYPDYPASWREWTVALADLGHYHDRIYWSWLVALSAKVSKLMGDQEESHRILGRLRKLAVRDQAIAEIYAPRQGLPPYESWLYRAETPFSWGAGFVLDAIR